ncbi:FAD-dependent oxidoreductase [Roseospira visakhapatnamensis]|uniref:Ferredoxin--NADP+ reductase n=1 Tax=Roseospira visakhapatnamensis TaxID=390880 RepID=A0A7W6RAG3_9PROT|nr:ferredoxin--NADP+ reductase [Roseospira visakhapatnamensis]
MTVSLCVVGSGPAGLYVADALARRHAGARIDVLERLPTPYGLVRAGVAPDHPGTKAVTRQFDRTLARPGVRFLGNVTVGRDIALAEVRAAYDAVILAAGAPEDRRLGIPGEDLAGVYGSGAFVGWVNGHPDHAALAPRLPGPAVAIIGAGNVALDIARVLARTPEEMARGDLCAHAARIIHAAPLTDLWVIGRRGPLDAAFTPAELSELGSLARARPVVESTALHEPTPTEAMPRKTLEILRGFAARPDAEDAPVRIRILFNAAPLAIEGAAGAVTALRLARTRAEDGRAVSTGETLTLPVGTVVSAIGYRPRPLDGAPLDEARSRIANTDGVIADGLFVVGWARRGPTGVIPANRADALAVADRVSGWLADHPKGTRPGPDALDALLRQRGVRVVSRADWERINQAEIACGDMTGQPRQKITAIAEMLSLLDDTATEA